MVLYNSCRCPEQFLRRPEHGFSQVLIVYHEQNCLRKFPVALAGIVFIIVIVIVAVP